MTDLGTLTQSSSSSLLSLTCPPSSSRHGSENPRRAFGCDRRGDEWSGRGDDDGHYGVGEGAMLCDLWVLPLLALHLLLLQLLTISYSFSSHTHSLSLSHLFVIISSPEYHSHHSRLPIKSASCCPHPLFRFFFTLILWCLLCVITNAECRYSKTFEFMNSCSLLLWRQSMCVCILNFQIHNFDCLNRYWRVIFGWWDDDKQVRERKRVCVWGEGITYG